MSWFFFVILSYLIFGVTSLADKYILSGRSAISDPKIYAFYVGIISIFFLPVIPFINFFIPPFDQLILSLFAGATGVLALFLLYLAVDRFEVSRVVPAVGGITPIAAMAFTYIFSSGKELINGSELIAFLFLVVGSVLITYERGKSPFRGFPFSFMAGLFFALFVVLMKYVYSQQPFLNGLVWARIGGLIFSLVFLFSKTVRQEVFAKIKAVFFLIFKQPFSKNNQTRKFWSGKESKGNAIVFGINQALGAIGGLLRELAIFLVPLSYIPVINAMSGIQYVFLLLLVRVAVWKYPRVFKEVSSGKTFLQKLAAILLIVSGLAILAFV
ncbi:MAG: hypothetical protein ABIF89_01915 [bacterium]